jgi:hypothetical protein
LDTIKVDRSFIKRHSLEYRRHGHHLGHHCDGTQPCVIAEGSGDRSSSPFCAARPGTKAIFRQTGRCPKSGRCCVARSGDKRPLAGRPRAGSLRRTFRRADEFGRSFRTRRTALS